MKFIPTYILIFNQYTTVQIFLDHLEKSFFLKEKLIL